MYASSASEINASKEEVIGRVCEMGFDREGVKKALIKHKWDESAAVNELLGAF